MTKCDVFLGVYIVAFGSRLDCGELLPPNLIVGDPLTELTIWYELFGGIIIVASDILDLSSSISFSWDVILPNNDIYNLTIWKIL